MLISVRDETHLPNCIVSRFSLTTKGPQMTSSDADVYI